jgi:Domain of unknown function (DUF3783)
MDDGTFSKVEKSTETMYGPRGILVCGYTKDEQKAFCSVLKKIQTEDIPVKFPGDADGPKTILTILENAETGDTEHSSLRRAVIMSGLTQTELHNLIRSHRESGLSYPLWASLTPVSETWLLKDLLEALAQEAMAMKQRRETKGTNTAKQT